MATKNEDIKWLYNKLKTKGYNIGTEDEFESSLSSEEDRKWYYDKAIGMGLNMGSMEDFDSLYAPQRQQAVVTDDKSEQGTATPKADVQTTIARTAQVQRMMDDFDRRFDAMEDNLQRTAVGNFAIPKEQQRQKAMEFATRLAGAPTKPLGAVFGRPKTGAATNEQRANTEGDAFAETPLKQDAERPKANIFSPRPNGVKYDENGKAQTQWLMPDGSVADNMLDAAQVEYDARQQRLQQRRINGGAEEQLRMAQAEREQLVNKMTERRKQIDARRNAMAGGSPIISGLMAAEGMNEIQNPGISDPEYAQYRKAIVELDKKIQTLKNHIYVKQGGDHGYWRSFGQTVSNPETWLGNVTGFMDFNATVSAMGNPKTESAQAMLNAQQGAEQAQSEFGVDNFWSRAGVMSAEMLPFALDFAMMNGMSGSAASAGTRLLTQKLLRNLPGMAANRAGKWTLKVLGAAPEELTKAAIMTNTIQAGKTAKDIAERKAGGVVQGEDGYEYENDKSWLGAAWQSEASNIIENYSEMFGTHLDVPLSVIGKGLAKGVEKVFGANRISDLMLRSSEGGLIRMGDVAQRFMAKQFGVSDITGEVAEEYVGQAMRTALFLDDAWQPKYDKDGNPVYKRDKGGNVMLDKDGKPIQEEENLFMSGQFHGDIWGGMALSVPLLRIVPFGVSGAMYAKRKHAVNRADRVASELMPDAQWEPLRERIDNTSNKEVGALAEEIVNGRMEPKAKAAVMDYVYNTLVMRGGNMVSLAQARKGQQNAHAQMIVQSFLDGYNAQRAEDLRAIRVEYNDAKEALAAELAATAGEGVDVGSMLAEMDNAAANDPVALLESTAPELQPTLLHYINAKQRNDGFAQAAQDNADEQVAQAASRVDARTNRDSGAMVPVVLKGDNEQGNIYYVVSGTVVSYEDGTANKTDSDSSLIVRNDATGELKFISPGEIAQVSAAINPEEIKQQQESAIRAGAKKRLTLADSGEIDFTPGQSYLLNADEDIGNAYNVTIEGPAVDEKGEAVEGSVLVRLDDGGEVVMSEAEVKLQHDRYMTQYLAERLAEQLQAEEQAQPEQGQAATTAGKSGETAPQAAPTTEEQTQPLPQQTPAPIEYNEGDEFEYDEDGRHVWGKIVGKRQDALGTTYDINTYNSAEDRAAGRESGMNSVGSEELSAWMPQPMSGEVSDTPEQTDGPGNAPQAETATAEYAQGYAYGVENGQYYSDTELSQTIEQLQQDEATLSEARRGLLAALEAEKSERAKVESINSGEATADDAFDYLLGKTDGDASLAVAIARQEQSKLQQRLIHMQQQLQAKKQELEAAQKPAALNIDPALPITEKVKLIAESKKAQREKTEALKAEVQAIAAEVERIQKAADHWDEISSTPERREQQKQSETLGEQRRAQEKERQDIDKASPDLIFDMLMRATEGDAETAIMLAQQEYDKAQQQLDIEKQQLQAKEKELKEAQKPMSVDVNPNQPIIERAKQLVQAKKARQEKADQIQAEIEVLRANVERARKTAAHWQEILSTPTRRQTEADAAAARAEDAAARQRAEEAARAKAEEKARKQAEGTNAVSPEISARWKAAPKVEGQRSVFYLPDGRALSGRYVLVEAGTAVPSHNPMNGFAKTEGFPVDQNGNTVNDRDYERDTNAQRRVTEMAQDYNGKAIQSVVVVSPDGIVLSGNNRTMSGDIAASNNTDSAYIEHLKNNDGMFTAEQIAQFKHPRKVFVLDEALPYTASTFAAFNKNDQKAQNTAEEAVKHGKTLTNESFGRIVGIMAQSETLGDFFRDDKAVASTIAMLRQDGVLLDDELEKYYSKGKLTEDGRIFMEKVLVGKSLDSNPDAARMAVDTPSIRTRIVSALMQIADNKTIDGGFDLSEEIVRAIELVYRAKADNSEMYATGKLVSPFGAQMGLFDEEDGASNVTDATVLMLADLLNHGREAELRRVLESYNKTAREAASGQMDMFTGEAESKEDILRQHLESYRNATRKQREQQEAEAAAARAAAARSSEESEAENADEGGEGPVADGAEYEDAAASGRHEGQKPEEPTEAQKAAGNYKMEHRRVDGYNISIENAKGSVRRGTGADGKPWETVMQNDYGYIRGTEGVDGDHIDVFLSDTPEEGDVFVVDQVNEDGSFDEHKVMYGFPTEQAARDAYLSNYEPGWTGLGAITQVSKDEFKKWVQSSRRKTKPFAEYKAVKSIKPFQLSQAQADKMLSAMKENAVIAPRIEVTEDNWKPFVKTPIGLVKMGENQKAKLFEKGRTDQYGMLLNTLSEPDIILEEQDRETNLLHERPSSYLFIKTYQKENGSKYIHFESVTVSQDGLEVSISSHIIRENQLRDKMKSDRLLYKATALDESANSSAEQPTNQGGSLSSEGKVTNSASEKQETGTESSEHSQVESDFEEKLIEFAKKLNDKNSIGIPALQREMAKWFSEKTAEELVSLDVRALARICDEAGLDAGNAWAFRMTIDKAMPKELLKKVWELRNARAKMSVGEEVGGNADAYNVAKGMLESSGIAVHEVGGEEAAAMMEQRGEDTRLMGSKTDRKMERIAEHYADKELDSNQRAVVDVFSGKADNVAIEVEREDGKRRVIMRQGKEQNVGTKHSILRHFETKSNYVTAEEIALIPEIIAKGERKVEGNRITYDYTAEDGSRLRVTTEISKGREVFTNLMSNRKPQNVESSKPFGDTQSSAPATTSEVSGAKVGNNGQTAKEIEGQNGEKLLKSPSGTVYGWTVGGEVWLNRDAMNSETPLHEYTHLWDDMVRKLNPELWARGKELLKQTPLWGEVLNDLNYADIAADEDAVASEVHSRLVGRDGAKLLEDMISKAKAESEENAAKTANLVERIKGWLQEMFQALKKTLEKWSKRDLDGLTIEQFNQMPLRDLAEGMNPKSADKNLVAVHNISEAKLQQALELGGLPMPSLAITRADIGHTDFGEISLVFGKESIDPANRRNKVYSGDAWTPTFPAIGYKLNSNRTSDIYDRANKAHGLPMFNSSSFHPTNYEGRMKDNEDSLVEAFANSYEAKQLYLFEKGNAVQEYVQHQVEKYREREVRLYEDMLQQIGEERLLNEKEEDLRPEVEALIAKYQDISKMPEARLSRKISHSILSALDYAENGNLKTERDLDATRAEIDKRVDPEDFRRWLEELFSGVIEEKGIRNGRDMYTPSGNMRKWESLYDALTLDNVLKAMQKQVPKGGQGIFGGSIFGSSTTEFGSVQEMRQEAARRIKSMPEEAYKAERKRILDRLSKLSAPKESASISDHLDFVDNVKDAVSKSHTASGIYKFLHDIYPGMTMDMANEIADIVKDIQQMSTRYFEAKPRRAVGFEEVKLAVVPEDTSKEIVDKLESLGIQVKTYTRGDEQQRQKLVSQATADLNLRFHRGRYGRSSLGLFDAEVPGLFDNLDAIKGEQIEQPDVSDNSDADAVNASIDRYVDDFAGYIKAEREVDADDELGDDEKDLRREQLENAILDKRDMLQAELAAHFRSRGDSEADALLRARDMVSEVQAQVSARLIDPERMKPDDGLASQPREGQKNEEADQGQKSDEEAVAGDQHQQKSGEETEGSYRSAGGDVVEYGSEGWLPASEPGEFCLVERKFVRDRQFDFTGSERIETADDVAYIFRQLENAAVEHAFVVFVKDGVPTVVHVGMGDVAMTLASKVAARGAWDAVGAVDEVYFVHNHPSGTLMASVQDRNLLKSLRGIFGDKLQDGIIIDTRSGKYATFDEMRASDTYDRPTTAKGRERQLTVSQMGEQVFSEDYDPEKLKQLTGSKAVAEFASSQRLGTRGKVGMLVLDHQLKVVGNFHLPYTDLGDTEALSEQAVKLAVRYGGSSVMFYGNYANSKEKLSKIKSKVEQKSGNNIRFLDSVTVKNGMSGGEYHSAFDEGMIASEPEAETTEAREEDEDVLCRPVTDQATLDRLNSAPTVKVYRAMQLLDGGLRPPMSAKVDGELREATEIGVWEEAEERPELANGKGKFKLNKGNGSTINAAYNPYIHTSRSPINDQFSSAWSRPELVTVEVEVPESELTSGYKADKAKDSVGEKEWKSGPVGRALAKIGQARRVILSRWGKVTRIVPVDEVAEEYAQRLNKHGIAVPFNTVPPALREALVKHGVKISEPEKGNAGESSRVAYEEWLEKNDAYRAMSRGRENFDTLRERAIAERGVVMPGLNDARVKVVEVERHDFTGTGRQAIDKARKWAEENLLGAHTYHIGQIDEFNYEIDNDAIDKYLSSSSTKGSDNLGVHLAALKKLPSIINSSLEVETHADYSKKDGKRNAENGIRDLNTLIHRFYGAVRIDGTIYRVKTTIKEVGDKKITPYNYQVTELELLISGSESSDALSNSNFVDAAKLLQDVEKSYDSGKKLLDESKKSDESMRQASQNSDTNSEEEKLSAMEARVGELAKVMHLGNVEVVRDASTLSGKRAKAKGFFNRRTGKITIVLPNNADVTDVAQTLLHEAVAHYGLRKLFGKDFEAFLDKVFESATPEVRGRIAQMSRQHDWDYLTATEEYLAMLAEDADFEKGFAAQGWWMRVKELFRAMLAKLGIGEAAQMGDKELRYTLWRSYQNLAHPQWESGPLGMAEASAAESDFDQKHEESEEEADYYRSVQSYNESVRGLGNQIKEAHHDGLRSLRVLQEEVSGGAKLKDSENVYLHMLHKTSVDRVEQEDMERRILKPLEKVCDAFVKKGIDGHMIDNYLICLHGAERNAYIGNKRHDRQDYSGLTGLFDPDGTLGLTVDQLEEEARKYASKMEGIAPAETAELRKLVKEASHWQLDKMTESGYISRETRDSLANRYQHYVPLEGYDESMAEDIWDYAGNVRILNAPMMHRAEGRKDRAGLVLSTLLHNLNRAIVNGNLNLVKQKYLALAMNYDSPLLRVTNQWIEPDGAGGWQAVAEPVIPDNATPGQIASILDSFEQLQRERLGRGEVKRNDASVTMPVHFGVDEHAAQHCTAVYRGGKTYNVWLLGAPNASQAVNGLLNNETQMNVITKAMSTVMRYMSKGITSLSPSFMARNLKRDLMSASIVGYAKHGARYAAQFEKNVGSIMGFARKKKGIYRLYSMYKKGNLNPADEQQRYFYEFVRNGGETGYSQIYSSKDYEKRMRRAMDGVAIRRKARAIATLAGESIEAANRGIENICRFAAYMTSRQMGCSILESVADAKEASVNFNRKGSGKMGNNLARSLYMFYNPAVQGLAQRLKLLKEGTPAQRARLIFSSFSTGMLGFAVTMLHIILGGGDGDDEEPDYMNITPWVRRNNVCFKAGDVLVKIPLSAEERTFYGLGAVAGEAVTGKISTSQAMKGISGQLSQMLPLDIVDGTPIISGEGTMARQLIKGLSPSALKPIFDAYGWNEDFAGRRITNQQEWNANLPEWKRTSKRTEPILKGASKAWSELTGGKDYRRSRFDSPVFNASAVEYMINQYMGARTSFPGQVWKTGIAIAQGDTEGVMEEMPILSGFISDTDNSSFKNRHTNDQYRYYLTDYKLTDTEIKGLRNDKSLGSEKIGQRIMELEDSGEIGRWKVMKATEKSLKKLRKAREGAEISGDSEALGKIDSMMVEVKKQAIRAINNIEE